MEAYKKYGTAKYLHDAFPNATYIGFTGTPVETKDKSTTNIFGNIIDVYDMTQAIMDGSTVPIMYESRMARVGLNQKILDEIDKAHPTVINLLYQILDEGKLTDAKNNTINLNNNIVIMITHKN